MPTNTNPAVKKINAAIMLIGDEILQGEIKDSNMTYMAQELQKKGIILEQVRIVGDNKSLIISTVNELRASHDYVFTTGGIGPTHDDITTDAIAAAFGVSVCRNKEVEAMMHSKNPAVSAVTLRMADLPTDAKLIPNPISHAPGFILDNVYVLAGVPHIMQAMMQEILPNLTSGIISKSQNIYAQTPESKIAILIEEVENEFESLSIGSYPIKIDGNQRVKLTLRSPNPDILQQATAKLHTAITALDIAVAYSDFE